MSTPRILYFDCFSGASGDMILGALLDAGLPLQELRAALGSLAIGEYEVGTEPVSRAGVAATKFRLNALGTPAAHIGEHHRHDEPEKRDGAHHEHHRSLEEISRLIDTSALSSGGKTRAKAMFQRLGEAEAAIHQTSLDRIHLHEVGALDSIVDIVGCVFAMEWFGADEVVASPLNLGSGTVVCAHGTFPVPAPATARLLKGVPVYSSGTPAELVTPTGALLITSYASAYGPLPAMVIERIGYGAGDRDVHDAPNVLRVLLGTSAASGQSERVVVIEFEVDDMNPQIFGRLMDALYAAGALDVFFSPIQMKKNRPGTLVTVISAPDQRDLLSGIVFRESTTIGVRYHEMLRERLDRETIAVETPIGRVNFKVARRRGEIVNAAPEFDDCARLADERRLSLKDVQAIAIKAYLDRT